MECLELAEVIDQFGWLTEICMTIFGGKEGFIVVCLIKLTGVILDFVAFVLAAEANGVCEGLSPTDLSDDSFGSSDSVSEYEANNCFFSGINTVSMLYILYQRIGAIIMVCLALKPWTRLDDNSNSTKASESAPAPTAAADNTNAEDDNEYGPNWRDLASQDPKSREARKHSAKLNMFFGAQWNLLDAWSSRYMDAITPTTTAESHDVENPKATKNDSEPGGDSSGTNATAVVETSRKREKIKFSSKAKKTGRKFGCFFVIEIIFWFILSFWAFTIFLSDSVSADKDVGLGDTFPMLWVLLSGYYGIIEYILVLFFAPLKSTTLGDDAICASAIKSFGGILICCVSCITFPFVLTALFIGAVF